MESFFEKQSLQANFVARDNMTTCDGNENNDAENCSAALLDPPHVRPKGVSNARLKGHFDNCPKTSSSK